MKPISPITDYRNIKMTEIRQNLITRDWVVIATERAKRPHEFIVLLKPKVEVPAYSPNCPFCAGLRFKNRISKVILWLR